MNGICFAACKSIVPADTWIPGQRFGGRAMESTPDARRPDVLNLRGLVI